VFRLSRLRWSEHRDFFANLESSRGWGYQIAMIRFIFILLFLTAPKAFSMPDCGLELMNLELPQALKVTSEAVTYLVEDENDRWLLESLSRIFTQINEASTDLVGLGRLVGEVPDEASSFDLSHHPFFGQRPDLISANMLEKLTLLADSDWAARLSGEDLALFAYLLRDFSRKPGRLSITSKIEIAENRSRYERVGELLKRDNLRSAAAIILSSPSGGVIFRAIWNEIIKSVRAIKPGYVEKEIDESTIDNIAKKILRGSDSPEIRKFLRHYLEIFVMDIQTWASGEKGIELRIGSGPAAEVRRKIALPLLPLFFAERLQMKSGIDDAVDIIDFMWFDTPVAMPSEVIYTSLVDGAKTLLLPLKSRYSQYKAELAKQKQVLQKEVVPFQISVVDHFKPGPSPFVRNRKSDEIINPIEVVTNIEDQIPQEESLRAFTSYVGKPRPLTDLKSDYVYRFWHLQKNPPRLESVRMSENVVDWIKSNPEDGQAMLDVLHMGQARQHGQGGIKRLRRKNASIGGAAYEIKIKGSNRGVLYPKDGEWQWQYIVDKAQVDHAVDNLH